MDALLSGQALQLNSYDKLYLLMSKWKLQRLFNPLCYAGKVTSIEDLESQLRTNLDELRRMVPLDSDELNTIKRMIEDSKMVNYEDLPRLLDIKRNNYREELEAAGVRIIPKEHVLLQAKIALGRPYSGDVYRAQWAQTHNNKIKVVVRYDSIPDHRELFVREAKIMTGLHHEYIIEFYGAVVLGPYAHSVGVVVEIFHKGNLEEFPVQSLFHAWLYASQLSSALEYLETKKLVHTSVVEPFVYIASAEKIRLGGFMCCYHKEETDKARESGYHSDMSFLAVTGHQGHHLDHLSNKGVVAMFSSLVIAMFRYLDSHHLRNPLDLFPGDKKWSPLFCPTGIASLMEQCMISDVEKRPTFQEIVEILAKEKPLKYSFTTDKSSSSNSSEISFKKGEKVWVISHDSSGYQGMWFGQKENGQTGFFEKEKVIKIDDDDDQVPAEIRARGTEAELAYRDALLEGKVKVCRSRLLIIGQDRAGKTSLKKSLMGLPFDPNEPSTELVEVNPLKFELSVEQVVEWKPVCDGNKEPASPEDRRVARLVADYMMKKKTEENERMSEEEKAHSEERIAIQPTELGGTSQTLFRDMPPSSTTQKNIPVPVEDSGDDRRKVPPTKKSKIAIPKELTPLVTECLRHPSVPNEDNNASETVLDIWDFAGQYLYYVTHPIFFSHRAVYLLVHNMSKDLHCLAEPSFRHGDSTVPLENVTRETNLDMLLSWLVSIHSIRQPSKSCSFVETCKKKLRCLPPPVLVVGTHADKVSSAKVKEVESEIIANLKGKTYQGHVLEFYRVDNTQSSNSTDIKAIQARVQDVLSSGLSSCADLPVKWFNFEKTVKKSAAGRFHLTLDEVRDVARQECFIEDDKQLEAMLNYYHDLGVIVRFKDTVVIDSQWLINIFKSLITICPYREQDAVDRQLWEELQDTGVLHMQLVNRVFENHDNGFDGRSLQQDVLDMMEKYGLLAKFHVHPESNESSDVLSSELKYFVPAQLRVSPGNLWDLTPQDTDPCPLEFRFCDGFVPHGLFAQLVSRLIGRFADLECTKSPKLFCNGVRFILGKRSEFDVLLLCSKRSIRLTLRSHQAASTDRRQVTENTLPVKVRSSIEEELENLCKQWHWLGNVHYEVCVTCLACKRHTSSSCSDQDFQHLLPITNVEPNTLMTCPDQVGDGSRFTLKGLHRWYTLSVTSEQMPGENGHTLAKARDIDVLELADEIPCRRWKVIGRLLGLEDALLDQIEVNKSSDVYEQCYEMLITWKRNQAFDATCRQLQQALRNKLIMRNDLVEKYCYVENT